MRRIKYLFLLILFITLTGCQNTPEKLFRKSNTDYFCAKQTESIKNNAGLCKLDYSNEYDIPGVNNPTPLTMAEFLPPGICY